VFAAPLLGSAVWGCAFLAIYCAPDTRIQANEWVEADLPAGTSLVVEDRNQLIPLPQRGGLSSRYRFGVLAVTEPDSAGKMAQFAAVLATGDVLVIPNRRWSAVLPRLASFP